MTGRIQPTNALQAGFSLLELLVVIAILALLAGVTAARVSGPSESAVLKAETRKVVSHLRAIRSRSLTESRIYSIEVTSDNHGYAIHPGEQVVELPGSIELHMSAGGGRIPTQGDYPSIKFYPDGSASGGSVTLSGPAGSSRVTVNWLTGEVAQKVTVEASDAS